MKHSTHVFTQYPSVNERHLWLLNKRFWPPISLEEKKELLAFDKQLASINGEVTDNMASVSRVINDLMLLSPHERERILNDMF